LKADGVLAVIVTNGGSGYISPPTIAFSGGGGTGATAKVSLIAEAKVYDIIDLATAKVILNVDQADTKKDDIIQLQISWISFALESYLKNKVAKQSISEIFSSDYVNIVKPAFFPVISVEKLQYIQEYKETYTEDDWLDYLKPYVIMDDWFHNMYVPRGLYLPNDIILSGLMTNRLKYTVGYEPDNIPANILIVVGEMLQDKIEQSKHGVSRLGKSSIAKGSTIVETTSYISLQPRWTELLKDYVNEENIKTVTFQR